MVGVYIQLKKKKDQLKTTKKVINNWLFQTAKSKLKKHVVFHFNEIDETRMKSLLMKEFRKVNKNESLAHKNNS